MQLCDLHTYIEEARGYGQTKKVTCSREGDGLEVTKINYYLEREGETKEWAGWLGILVNLHICGKSSYKIQTEELLP